jgi:predicted glycosyltransferase
MKALVDISHPAQVHLFKNMIFNLMKDGHDVKITTRDKEVTLDLLRAYHLEFECTGKNRPGLLNKAVAMFKNDIEIYKIAKKFNPDLFISAGSPYAAHVSRLLGRPHISFYDSEPVMLIFLTAFPFTDVICTPTSYKKNHAPDKHIKYNGFKELAYLHPNYFKPDRTVLDDLGLHENDRYAILRFVAWQASHDVGHAGFNLEEKRMLVKELEKRCKVFITSEKALPPDLEKYRIKILPHRLHDMLYYADLLVCDGQTMTTEAAVLGTPAIQCNSLVGTMGNFDELEKKYGLIFAFKDSKMAIAKAIELIENKDIKKEWKIKRERLLEDKIDVTQFMTKFIEDYPDSFYELRENE